MAAEDHNGADVASCSDGQTTRVVDGVTEAREVGDAVLHEEAVSLRVPSEDPVIVDTASRPDLKCEQAVDGMVDTQGRADAIPQKEAVSPRATDKAKILSECDAEMEGQGEAPDNMIMETIIDDRPRVPSGAVRLNETDTTLNVMLSNGASVLSSMGEAGFQYLLAGARGTTGIKSGIYAFEIKVLECKGIPGQKLDAPCMRLGFSLPGSSLLLKQDDNVCFNGFFAGALTGAALRIVVDRNKETWSVFCNGKQTSTKSIQETLRGKPVYPTITYRNITLQVNFGPLPMFDETLSCRMLAEAAEADVEIPNQSGTECEVLFPVGLPGQGAFEWADEFLQSHPNFVELSNRMILEWLKISLGLENVPLPAHCMDRPSFPGPFASFAPAVQDTIWGLAPMVKRNYIVMELIGNLTADGRQINLRRNWSGHRKGAIVVFKDDPPAKGTMVAPTIGAHEVTEQMISATCVRFSLPRMEEGFDYIKYPLQPEGSCAEFLQAYITSCKVVLPSCSIKPSDKFLSERTLWEKRITDMQKSQEDWKKKEPAIEVPANMNTDEIANIEDVYNGWPLYANFEYEDWLLLQLRTHVHLLMLAFQRDVSDPEQQHIHHSTFSFYYLVFFGRKFDAAHFSQHSAQEVFDLITDTVKFDSSTGLLYPLLDEHVQCERLVKFVYIARNERLEMFDRGDETALLRFPRTSEKISDGAASIAAKAGLATAAVVAPAHDPLLASGFVVNPPTRPPAPRIVAPPPREDLFEGRTFVGQVKYTQTHCFIACAETFKIFARDIFVGPNGPAAERFAPGSKVQFTVELNPYNQQPRAKGVSLLMLNANEAARPGCNAAAVASFGKVRCEDQFAPFLPTTPRPPNGPPPHMLASVSASGLIRKQSVYEVDPVGRDSLKPGLSVSDSQSSPNGIEILEREESVDASARPKPSKKRKVS